VQPSQERRPGEDGYWQALIRADTADALDEVGHTDMGRAFNRHGYRLRRRAVEHALRASGALPPNGIVFEGAFGVGFYLPVWEALGATVTGVDLSPTAVANVRSRFPGCDLRVGDLSRLSDWDDWTELVGSFDVVTAIDVLYHIVEDELAAVAVGNLAALVRPGGVLIFTEKFPEGARTLEEHAHVTRRPLRWFVEALADQDLVVERVAPVFWCMDPALPNSKRSIGDHAARALWVGIRAATKYLPRRGRLQETIGSLGGLMGESLDRVAVGRVRSTGNLFVVTMRRSSETSARTRHTNL
jgi:SAM-dependent methyltransferase